MASEKLLAEIAPGPIGQEVKREGRESRDRACALLERGDTPVAIRVEDTLILVLDKNGKRPLGPSRPHIRNRRASRAALGSLAAALSNQ